MSITSLGEPIHAVCIWAVAYGQEAGADRVYAVSSGKPCVLFVIDPHTGQCLAKGELIGSNHCWGVVVTKAGVFINADGYLYRYTADTGVQRVGEIRSGDHYTWRMAADTAGRVYGGTYPGGTAYQYDPQTGNFRNYGVVVDGEQYVRSMKATNDHLYIGGGTQQAFLVRLDVESGERQPIKLPEEAKEEQLVYDLDIIDSYLFVRTTPSNIMYTYHLETGQWIDRQTDVAGLAISPLSDNDTIYMMKNQQMHSYHMEERQWKNSGFTYADAVADYGYIYKANEAGEREQLLIWLSRNGYLHQYHTVTGVHDTIDLQLTGQPVAIQSLTKGDDGNIYVGGYFAGGLAVYNPTTGNMQLHKQIGQIENMIAFHDKLYMGVYPKAIMYQLDTKQIDYSNMQPEQLFQLTTYRQDRPFAFTVTEEAIVIGTVPDYGCHGGALTFYNPITKQTDIHTAVVEKQSIISLTYREGIVYAGSSVWGGLGIAPVKEEAVLTMWDVEQQRISWQGVVIAGEKAISALVCDEQGYIWGLTAGTLFQFDPTTKQLLQQKELFPFDWNAVPHYWRGGYLLYRAPGQLIISTMGTLLLFHMDTLQSEVIAKDVMLLTEDDQGNCYYATGTELYRVEIAI